LFGAAIPKIRRKDFLHIKKNFCKPIWDEFRVKAIASASTALVFQIAWLHDTIYSYSTKQYWGSKLFFNFSKKTFWSFKAFSPIIHHIKAAHRHLFKSDLTKSIIEICNS